MIKSTRTSRLKSLQACLVSFRQAFAGARTSMLLAGILVLSNQASAEFTIQIGAYQHLSDNIIQRAESLGPVKTSAAGKLTRVTVGSYTSREGAAADLAKVKASGFDGAFVRTAVGGSSGVVVAQQASHYDAHSHGPDTHVHLPNNIQRKLDTIDVEDRDNVVILDGKLHRKIGDTFVPL